MICYVHMSYNRLNNGNPCGTAAVCTNYRTCQYTNYAQLYVPVCTVVQ